VEILLLGADAPWKADALLLPLEEGRHAPDLQVAGWLADSPALRDFRAKSGRTALAHAPDADAPVARVAAAGLGTAPDAAALRDALAAACGLASELGCQELGIALETLPRLEGRAAAAVLEEALLGALLGAYRYQGLKSEPPETAPPAVLRVFCPGEPDDALRRAAQRADAQAQGIALARDLTNAPGNVATPTYMAETARHLAREYGFSVQVLGLEQARELGMGAFVAVAQGSDQPPAFIVLEHAPQGREQEPPVVLAGKGITFDTGGISIKPSAKMEEMKGDMAGAAAVLGAFKALGMLGVERRVVGLVPCTENMPDGRSIKPGDTVQTLAGKSVEIINTDAEGRLVLCDALAYAERYRPALVADIATLTGACVVALGPRVGAAFSGDEALARRVQERATALGDLFWPMPLWDLYAEALKSEVADLRNVGPREGGAIHAAMFLKQFAPRDTPWVHLDIAGPGWSSKKQGWISQGGTGAGVRTLLALAEEDFTAGS
jgi:leucyl aminopeptidase